MTKSTRMNRNEREARWRKLIERQAASGRSIAAFCRDESIPVQTFYGWRARLGKQAPRPAARRRAPASAFIDLGTMGAAAAREEAAGSGLHIRLDLPGGITLTVARR
jgi:hypothetical protein